MPPNEFFRTYGLYIALTVFAVIVVLIVLFLAVPRLQKKEETPITPTVDKNDFLALLGGEDNIKEIFLDGSRLSVWLIDMKAANVEDLKKHGVDRVIVMKTKLVLLIDSETKKLFKELP